LIRPDQREIQIPTTKRSRRAPTLPRTSYPAEFEAEWSQTARTGSKDKACTFWEKAGRPRFGAAWKLWEASAEWKADWFHYPHVRTWLSDGRYLQDPNEARVHAAPAPGGDLEEAERRLFGRNLGGK